MERTKYSAERVRVWNMSMIMNQKFYYDRQTEIEMETQQ